MTQLPIAFPQRATYGARDFLRSDSNAEALRWIEAWPCWPGGGLLIHGPANCGKTHLAHLWCERSGGEIIDGAALDDRRIATLFAARGRDRPRALAIDDADRAGERPLLHFYNLCREEGLALLLTARQKPWRVALPDLSSRLNALPAAAVRAPDDALLAAVLVKHFADRQLRVPPAVIAYLLARIERSFAAAADIAARLDASALALGRPVTLGLARRLAGGPEVQSSAASDRGGT